MLIFRARWLNNPVLLNNPQQNNSEASATQGTGKQQQHHGAKWLLPKLYTSQMLSYNQ